MAGRHKRSSDTSGVTIGHAVDRRGASARVS